MFIFDPDIVAPWVLARAGGGQYIPGTYSAIGRTKDGRIVGGIIYESFNGANVFCHIAGEGRWMNREFLRMIFDYPFRQLGVRRMTAMIVSNNEKCINFVKKLGFEKESEMYQAHNEGDIIIYRLMAKDCRWLEINNGQRK